MAYRSAGGNEKCLCEAVCMESEAILHCNENIAQMVASCWLYLGLDLGQPRSNDQHDVLNR